MKYATVGTSSICKAFIAAAKASTKLELDAVFSRNEQTGQRFAQEHGVSKVYSKLSDMAIDPDFSLVYIASPNSLHYEQVIQFLKGGKHVICEKPIFANGVQWQHAFEVAEQNQVYLFEAIRNIHDPNFRVLQDSLVKVGNLQNVIFHYCQLSSRYSAYLSGEEPNVFSLKYAGGTLVDLGVYPLYIAIALFGKPLSSTYIANKLTTGVDGSGTLVLQYYGFQCTIICSKISNSRLANEIQGSQGVLLFERIHDMSPLTFCPNQSDTREVIPTISVANNMIHEINQLVDVIERNNTLHYAYLKNLSGTVMQITEQARRQNGIQYVGEENN